MYMRLLEFRVHLSRQFVLMKALGGCHTFSGWIKKNVYWIKSITINPICRLSDKLDNRITKTQVYVIFFSMALKIFQRKKGKQNWQLWRLEVSLRWIIDTQFAGKMLSLIGLTLFFPYTRKSVWERNKFRRCFEAFSRFFSFNFQVDGCHVSSVHGLDVI